MVNAFQHKEALLQKCRIFLSYRKINLP
jgi:hypothetical protein